VKARLAILDKNFKLAEMYYMEQVRNNFFFILKWSNKRIKIVFKNN